MPGTSPARHQERDSREKHKAHPDQAGDQNAAQPYGQAPGLVIDFVPSLASKSSSAVRRLSNSACRSGLNAGKSCLVRRVVMVGMRPTRTKDQCKRSKKARAPKPATTMP